MYTRNTKEQALRATTSRHAHAHKCLCIPWTIWNIQGPCHCHSRLFGYATPLLSIARVCVQRINPIPSICDIVFFAMTAVRTTDIEQALLGGFQIQLKRGAYCLHSEMVTRWKLGKSLAYTRDSVFCHRYFVHTANSLAADAAFSSNWCRRTCSWPTFAVIRSRPWEGVVAMAKGPSLYD